MTDDTSDYWWDQRLDDAYFDLHGHLLGQDSSECSLCQEL